MSNGRRPGPDRRARVVRVVLAVVLAAAVAAACAGPPPAAGARAGADAVGPPEITANATRSPLPVGTPGQGTPPIVLGTKDFSEQFLLGELYTQALRAKGFTVTLDQNLGGSEIIDSAFASDRIQMYPEYLGEVASGLAGQAPARTAGETYGQAQQFERSARGATILDQTPYQNTDVVIVRQELAARYGITSVPDLARIATGGEGVTIAAQPPFRTRTSGLLGMQQVYGLTGVQLLAVSPDETYQALDAGQAQAADAFSTDAQLATGRYVELDDPQNIFGFQYVAPVVKQATVDRSGPAFVQTCNWVSSLLTVGDVRAMNQRIQLGGADEATVAREFLAARGLR